MSKKELADHLADDHGIWLTRREYRTMSYEDVQAMHDNAQGVTSTKQLSKGQVSSLIDMCKESPERVKKAAGIATDGERHRPSQCPDEDCHECIAIGARGGEAS